MNSQQFLKEFNAILKPFLDNYDEYIESYVMPEVIAYYIANSYYRNAMYEGSFLQHYNSAKDLINMFGENEEKVKAEVFKLLRVKYSLSITNENPLEIKKIEYQLFDLILFCLIYFPKNSRKTYNCVNIGGLWVQKKILFLIVYSPGGSIISNNCSLVINPLSA